MSTTVTIVAPEEVFAHPVPAASQSLLGAIYLDFDHSHVYLSEGQARLLMAGIVTALADVYDATEATK